MNTALPTYQRAGVTIRYAGTCNPPERERLWENRLDPEPFPAGARGWPVPDLGWEDNDVALKTTFSDRYTIVDYGSLPYRYAVIRDEGRDNEETVLVADEIAECLDFLFGPVVA